VVFITHQTSLTLITQPVGTRDAPTTTNINRKVMNPHAKAMKNPQLGDTQSEPQKPREIGRGRTNKPPRVRAKLSPLRRAETRRDMQALPRLAAMLTQEVPKGRHINRMRGVTIYVIRITNLNKGLHEIPSPRGSIGSESIKAGVAKNQSIEIILRQRHQRVPEGGHTLEPVMREGLNPQLS
jgi:hypothetical protein